MVKPEGLADVEILLDSCSSYTGLYSLVMDVSNGACEWTFVVENVRGQIWP